MNLTLIAPAAKIYEVVHCTNDDPQDPIEWDHQEKEHTFFSYNKHHKVPT